MRKTLAVLVALVALAGCASPRPDRSPVPSATQTAGPAVAGTPLRQIGIQNGPSNLALPAGVSLEHAIDQPNVVTLFFSRPSPEETLAHLRTALPAAGLRVTADAGGSLLFEGAEWAGSYTATDGLNALTLRRR